MTTHELTNFIFFNIELIIYSFKGRAILPSHFDNSIDIFDFDFHAFSIRVQIKIVTLTEYTATTK